MSDHGSTPPPEVPPPLPPDGGIGAGGTPPPSYLVWAILSTVLCFLPLGVAAVVYAAQVNGKWAAGDVSGAQRASERAKALVIWAAIVAVVLYGIVVLLALLLRSFTLTVR